MTPFPVLSPLNIKFSQAGLITNNCSFNVVEDIRLISMLRINLIMHIVSNTKELLTSITSRKNDCSNTYDKETEHTEQL